MKTYLMAAAAAVALCFVAGAEKAEAAGFHFSNGRVHVDIGNPHGRWGGGYRGGWGGHGHGGHGGHGRWHDTTHYDYHAPSLRWHGDHVDFVPGHYDLHRTGHWHH